MVISHILLGFIQHNYVGIFVGILIINCLKKNL